MNYEEQANTDHYDVFLVPFHKTWVEITREQAELFITECKSFSDENVLFLCYPSTERLISEVPEYQKALE